KDGHGDCSLEDVRTEKDVLRIEWKKNGVSLPLIEIRPIACARGATANGPEFSMTAPDETAKECPAAVEKLKSLVASESFGGAVRLGAPSGSRWPVLVVAGAATLLIAAAVFFVIRRRRRARSG